MFNLHSHLPFFNVESGQVRGGAIYKIDTANIFVRYVGDSIFQRWIGKIDMNQTSTSKVVYKILAKKLCKIPGTIIDIMQSKFFIDSWCH